MNYYAYHTAGYAVGALAGMTRANFRIHGEEKIPTGSLIFVINHFTRMETIFLPYFINRITGLTVWSLADNTLFKGNFGKLLENLGAMSNKNPDRDRLIVRSLLTGESAWIIFPEGRMVKNKKVYSAGKKDESRFMILSASGLHPPRTGAATLSLRTEFYRRRLAVMQENNPEEARRILDRFGIEDPEPIHRTQSYIVPVNITYHPMRGRENNLNRLAGLLMGEVSERMTEEIMMEGSMLLSGVDVDIRFGDPIRAAGYINTRAVKADMASNEPIGFDDPIASRPMLRKTALRIMGRYMSAIYRMTSVNPDHILATLLKHCPQGTIDVKDLRRRVFLALATIDYDKLGIFRHQSLSRNPAGLLTDDPYKRIASFVKLAVEKGVLAEQDGRIKKIYDFEKAHEFHQIRIENPIAVAANEIEPMDDLQEMLKSIARQPSLRIQYQIRRHLLEKGDIDFEKDYFRFAEKGAAKPKEVGSPFFIQGSRRDIGVLLVHGYMAAPLEVRALGERIAANGYPVYGVRLRGHGTAPEDLAQRSHEEWTESVAEGYAIMSNLCQTVVAGGFSFGAGLVLDLCTRTDDIRAVFAISAPLKLQDFSSHFVGAVHLWNSLVGKLHIPSASKRFVKNNPENPHINYTRNPISGVAEMGKLMNQLEPKLSAISIPALIIQSERDPVVHPAGSMRIFKGISSEDKQYVLVNTPRHGIVNGDGSERVFYAVEGFIAGLSSPPSPGEGGAARQNSSP